MFYVSSKRGNLYGVTDSSDNQEEFYSPEDIYNILRVSKNIIILGVTRTRINVVPSHIIQLIRLKGGTPLKVKMGSCDSKQVIYCGCSNDGTFNFFDGSGISGYFSFTYRFLSQEDSKVSFIFNDNDATKVARLIEILKGN